MALLFVLGVMNLWWIALVAATVLLEKTVRVDAISRVLGVGADGLGGRPDCRLNSGRRVDVRVRRGIVQRVVLW